MLGDTRWFLKLFHPLSAIIVTAAVIVIAVFVIRKFVHSSGSNIGLKITLCIIGAVAISFLSFKVFMSNFEKSSRVDITPLAQLAAKSLYNKRDLEECIEKLSSLVDVERLRSHFGEANTDGLFGSCSYDMYNWDIPASVSVFISIFNTADNAQKRMEQKNDFIEGRREILSISENVDVILCHSRMYRSADTFLSYNDRRVVQTVVRSGNIVINFSENESFPYEIGALTSKNIALLCELLGD